VARCKVEVRELANDQWASAPAPFCGQSAHGRGVGIGRAGIALFCLASDHLWQTATRFEQGKAPLRTESRSFGPQALGSSPVAPERRKDARPHERSGQDVRLQASTVSLRVCVFWFHSVSVHVST
jgi:hypothetical protein